MPSTTGKDLAKLLNDYHSDEWAGAEIADALTGALEEMPLSGAQLAILGKHLTKLDPQFQSFAPTTPNASSGM